MLAGERLEAGEEMMVGLRVNLKGTALGVGLAAGAAGMAGLALGSAVMEAGQEQAHQAGIAFSQQMALGLTDQRIILWERSALSDKPK